MSAHSEINHEISKIVPRIVWFVIERAGPFSSDPGPKNDHQCPL